MKKWGKVIVLLTVCVIGFVGGYFVNGWLSNKNANSVKGHTYEYVGSEVVWEDDVTEEQKQSIWATFATIDDTYTNEEEVEQSLNEMYSSVTMKFEKDGTLIRSGFVDGEYIVETTYYQQSLDYSKVKEFQDANKTKLWATLEIINGKVCWDVLSSGPETTIMREYVHVYVIFEKTA